MSGNNIQILVGIITILAVFGGLAMNYGFGVAITKTTSDRIDKVTHDLEHETDWTLRRFADVARVTTNHAERIGFVEGKINGRTAH